MRGLGTWFCEAVTPHPPASAGTFSHWEKEHPTTTATPCRAATRSRRSETQPVRRRSIEKEKSPRCHHSWLSPSDGRQRRRAQEVAAKAGGHKEEAPASPIGRSCQRMLTDEGLRSLTSEAATPHPPALQAPSPIGRRGRVLEVEYSGIL